MEQPVSSKRASILQELDLGQHTLFLMSNGSLDLLANDAHTPFLADNMLSLDRDETYRLYISLHEHFKQQGGESSKQETLTSVCKTEVS